MYDLFNQTKAYGSYIVPAGFNNVEARTVEDVDRVIQYYREGAFSVKNDHLLVKLINTVAVPLGYPLEQYYDIATLRTPQVSTSLELTSSISRGRWFDGVFYYGSKEVLFGITNGDDPREIEKDWRNVQAVRVLEHPVSNMKYMLPSGHEHNTERGYAFIEIDIPKLMVQYRAFYFDQKNRALLNPSHPIASVGQFVARYVIPNMLRSQTDIVIVNRLMNLYYGAPMGDSIKRHPFQVSDYTLNLDKALTEVLKRITNAQIEYGVVLKQIPHVFSDRPFRMPDIAETIQVWWALYITRIKTMIFLWDVGGERGRHFNQAAIGQLKIELKRFKSDNVFQRRLPIELFDEVNFFTRHVQSGL